MISTPHRQPSPDLVVEVGQRYRLTIRRTVRICINLVNCVCDPIIHRILPFGYHKTEDDDRFWRWMSTSYAELERMNDLMRG